MQFTGKNLDLIHQAVQDAILEIQSQIGSCPNVHDYADDIEELEALQAKYERLDERISKALQAA